MTYSVGSLFAGIGGICLGFNNAKVNGKKEAKVIWANEWDKNACITYRQNLCKKHNYLVEGDVRSLDPDDEKIPYFDILTGGFPCQAFSVAGNRLGFSDTRGTLFFDIMRFIKRKDAPRAFLLENVKNLIGHDKGNTLKVIEQELTDAGYHFTYFVFNSMEYGNVPQNRERIYIVGFKEKEALEYFLEKPIEKKKLKRTIKTIINPKQKKEEKYYYKPSSKFYDLLKEKMKNPDTVYQLRRIYVRENKSNVSPTLTANMGTGGHNVPLVLDDFGIRKLTPRETLLLQGFPGNYEIPKGMADSHIYKQAGNSVTVPVIQSIAEKMISSMKKTDEK